VRDDVNMEDFDLDTAQGWREYNLAVYADDPKMLRHLKISYALADVIGIEDIPEFQRQLMRRTVREVREDPDLPPDLVDEQVVRLFISQLTALVVSKLRER
jgi:hypothetical protein